jgi:hypothetical protein
MHRHVGWVGSGIDQVPKPTSSGKKLYKTHMNLKPFLRSNEKKSPKVIVVFRDPVAVLDSWHRHVTEVCAMSYLL